MYHPYNSSFVFQKLKIVNWSHSHHVEEILDKSKVLSSNNQFSKFCNTYLSNHVVFEEGGRIL